jgi:aspartyl-tRNA(Asn)/glutamyl-tRNA(Gln) amidotransferase subunit B
MDELLDFAEAVERFEPTIGIETHVELSTVTKMFCPSAYVFDAPPNSLTTPVSLGLPGSLPVLNQRALEYAIKIGLALNCQIAAVSHFARKNYFYPDLTKNYQISQSDQPIATDGFLDVEVEGEIFRIEIERAHMEEDAGKNTHVGSDTGRIHGAEYSLIDYNRAGVPLVEIVTRPFSGAGAKAGQLAAAYVRALRDICIALGVSDARMERGNLRADVNLSLKPRDRSNFGTRTETKNVNSFRSIERACVYEIRRQAALLVSGQPVVQETRHFSEATGETSAGRVKSDSDDYRYFPEPDLPPVRVEAEQIERLRAELPELPVAKRQRLQKLWGLSDLEMRDILNVGALELIEATVELGATWQGARKWWLGEILRAANAENRELLEFDRIAPADVAELEKMIAQGALNDKLARQAVNGVLAGEGNLAQVIQTHQLTLVQDTALIDQAIQAALDQNPDVAAKLQAGDFKPLGVIIGGVMKTTSGKADAASIRQKLLDRFTPDNRDPD